MPKKPEGISEDWTAYDACTYAGKACQASGASGVAVIWVGPVSGSEHEMQDISYAVAGLDRSSLLALLIHTVKNLVMKWF